MPRVTAGPMPFGDRYKAFRKNAKEGGSEYYEHTTKGWRAKRYGDEWEHQPEKQKYKSITIHGRKHKIPDADYDDFMRMNKLPPQAADSAISEYIAKGFVDKEDTVKTVEGVGHIAMLEYAPVEQLLRVTFQPSDSGGGGDAVVVYLMVPPTTFYQLKMHAESRDTRTVNVGGKKNPRFEDRHLLGIEFWNIVRIRGNMHGSRYTFMYSAGNTSLEKSEEQKADEAELKETKETIAWNKERRAQGKAADKAKAKSPEVIMEKKRTAVMHALAKLPGGKRDSVMRLYNNTEERFNYLQTLGLMNKKDMKDLE